MALVESIFIPLGTKIPEFSLKDPNGLIVESSNCFTESKALLVAFMCNHCPYALAVWPRFIRLAEYAQENDIAVVAINPNINPNYPQDSSEAMAEKIDEWDLDFPYLIDQDQQTARNFKAQCTPDIYLFDSKQVLVYHGRIDDNWKNENQVTCEDLKLAIEALVNNTPINQNQKPSLGCSIKWC